MPYVPPHLREGYVPAAPATAEMLGINAKSQSIRPNLAPVPLAKVRPLLQRQLAARYQNTIQLHKRRKSYKKHRGHHHVSKSRKRSKLRSKTRSRTISRR
jgi:hypothetical protein